MGRVIRLYYTSEADSIGGVNRELRWGYDQRGRLKADTSYTGTVARATTYTYDSYERVSQLSDPSGNWTTQFDADLGVPTTMITPFADTLVYDYDEQLRPTGPTIKSSGPQRTTAPAWNVAGRLDSLAQRVNTPTSWTPLSFYSGIADEPSFQSVAPYWTEQHGSGTALDSLRDSVQYDGWERVTAVVSFRNGNVVARDTFGFDRMGNITTTADSQVYDPVTNRLLYRVNGTWRDSLVYDAAGNLDSLVSKKGAATNRWGYDWDVLNRLVTVRRNGTLIARYSYDVLGRRIAKRVYSTVTGGVDAYTSIMGTTWRSRPTPGRAERSRSGNGMSGAWAPTT
jgi:YD repeat-containing protein